MGQLDIAIYQNNFQELWALQSALNRSDVSNSTDTSKKVLFSFLCVLAQGAVLAVKISSGSVITDVLLSDASLSRETFLQATTTSLVASLPASDYTRDAALRS